jgi:chitinase
MAVRTTALASVLVLALFFAPAVPGKRPPSPGDKQAPTAPTNLRITASSEKSVSLAWAPSTDNSTNWWYCVQVNGASCNRVDPPQTTFTRSGLQPDTTTTFSVYAIDAAGNRSANSNSVTFTTPPDTTAPSPPPTLTATAVFAARIGVSWTASVDNTTEVFYTLFVDGTPYADTGPYRGRTVIHLQPSSTYVLMVRARDGHGNTVDSNPLSVTTPAKTDNVAPAAPTNLRFGLVAGDGEVWLNWDQATDDSDPQSLLLYDVQFNGVSFDDDSVFGTGSAIAYCRTVTGPTQIVVRAVDTSGNVSAPSNALDFTC